MFEFLHALIYFFDKYQIPYMLSGSMGMSIYTGPRYTRDFDFVVHLRPSDVTYFINYFKEGYYCDEDSIKEAIQRKSMFNIIDHKSNYKADFIIMRDDEFEIIKFERRLQVPFLNYKIYVISKEDLLLSKLAWIQVLKSAEQTNDILNLSELPEMDWTYIHKWISTLKLNTFGLIKK